MATFDIGNKIQIVNPSANVDAKYGPWNSIAEAKTGVIQALREKGLTVGVIESESIVEYWWKSGITDNDLVLKTEVGGGSGTPGVSVTNATINVSGHLIITLSDNTTIDAGVAVGPQGSTGAAGATGTTGNGIASTSYNASTGVLTITYTSGGTYSTGDLRGAAGATGAAGSKWYNGVGAPSAGTGVSGDYYLNTANGDVYVKTTSWAVLTNIKGATGATGATGSTGANGATWLSGSSAPTTQGVNGDFYLNTTTYDVSLKTSGTWNVVVNIKGPIGNTGATGATGATGKGISSITKTNTVGQIDTYTITYTDSTTTTFDVVNGANYTHPTGDGNLHVPATSTTSNGKVLTAGATAGSAAWEAPAIGDAHGFVAPPNTGTYSYTNTGSSITFNLLAAAGNYKINGALYVNTGLTKAFTAALGQNFIYLTATGLQHATTQWTITDLTAIPVATLNWDGTNVRVSDELHLASRNLIQHQKEHDTDGARYVSGFATTFAAAAANTFSAAAGVIRDEERYHNISAKTQAQIAYRNAAGTAMIFDAPGTAFVKIGGTGGARPLYDNGSGTPVELGSSQYGIMWMYATNGKLPANSEIVFVMGQGTYASVAAAQAANQPTLSGMAIAEWKLLYRVIIRQSPTNALVFTQADDFRLSSSGPAQNAGAAVNISANAVTVTPAGNLTSTNVQAALEELQTKFETDPIPMYCSDMTSDLTASTTVSKLRFMFEEARTLQSVVGSLATAATGGSLLTVDIKKNGTSIFSTLLTFDSGENTTRTAATQAVLTGSISFAIGDYIDIYVTQVGSTTAGKGLLITLKTIR